MDDKLLLQELIKNLRIGLFGVESKSSGGYTAINKDTNALGKYQFLPKYYWNDIKRFAKKKGYGTISEYKDFLDKPDLQEEYFEKYTKDTIFPKAKEYHKKYGDSRKLSIDEIGALIHFQGAGGANSILKSGKHKSRTKINIGSLDYLNKYNEELKSNNINKLDNKRVLNDADKGLIYSKYVSDKANIVNDDKLSDTVKALKLEELNKDNYRKGNFPVINEKLDALNKEKEKEFQEKKNKLITLSSFLNNASAHFNPNTNEISGIYFTNVNNEFDELLSEGRKSGLVRSLNNGVFEVNKDKLISEVQSSYKDITGKEIDIINDENVLGGDAKIEIDSLNRIGNALGDLGERGYQSGDLKFKDQEKFNLDLQKKPFNINVHGYSLLTPNPTWNYEESSGMELEEEDPKTEDLNLSSDDPFKYTEDDLKKIRKQARTEGFNEGYDAKNEAKRLEQEADEKNLLELNDSFYAHDLDEPTPRGNYKEENFKNNFPFLDVLGAGVSIVAGTVGAQKDIPYRDEKVNDAFLNYASELARLSKIGLSPEEEAMAKQNLAESYSGALKGVVRASGGDRNIVLGNLGRLDAQKQHSLSQLAIEEANIKRQALYQYGEAMKYINEYDTNRDIANNERLYRKTLRDKEASADLASMGWETLMDNLAYYEENKPGSANQMRRSQLYREAFGFDPQLKDDGTGQTPYTRSWAEEQDKKAMEEFTVSKEYAEKWVNLTPEQKINVSKKNEETGYDINKSRQFIDEYYSPMANDPKNPNVILEDPMKQDNILDYSINTDTNNHLSNNDQTIDSNNPLETNSDAMDQWYKEQTI